VEGTSIKGDWSRADNRDNKGARPTISKGTRITRGGIEGIVVLLTGIGHHLYLKV
jgi:hypothetical protein